MPEKTSKPYGLWPSPISALTLGQHIRLDELGWDNDGETLVWLEGRSDRGVLVAQSGMDARRDLTVSHSVRGGVGYGGGEFSVSQGRLFFTERNGQIYTRSLAYGTPHPITPPFGACASPVLSPDGQWVVYVFSDGQTDLLGLVDSEGRDWPVQLARGADFYSQPAWNVDGKWLTWCEWNHPNMPWDGTLVKLARLEGSPLRIAEEFTLGGDAATPAAQPVFSPDGTRLCFIEGYGEYERLIVVELATRRRSILFDPGDRHLMLPAWVQGNRSLGWAANGQSLYCLANRAGLSELLRISLDGRSARIDSSPYTWLTQLTVSPVGDKVACLASSPHISSRVTVWENGQARVLARGDAENLPPGYTCEPQPLTWRAANGSPVYGLYYPPTHPNFNAEGKPPVIINIHGGPTGAMNQAYASEATYFTSRGYGWFYINYRGSTGYGRSYSEALRQRWGDYDVEDAASGALALVELGLANPKQLVIHGGSAGGYTVLNALIRYPGRFKAGICLFGVSNLFSLDQDTHKFEAHYTHSLVGELPEAAPRYHAWSPVFHADAIRDPMYIFQGADDKVVPPSQSEEIVAALRRNGVPHQYRLYEGEGHGWRKSETIVDYYKEMEQFLQQYVLFAP
jgi:dipeptidyl aminopeptidase/acylaminoacyl peptidase